MDTRQGGQLHISGTEAPRQFVVKSLSLVFFEESLAQGKDNLEVRPVHSFSRSVFQDQLLFCPVWWHIDAYSL